MILPILNTVFYSLSLLFDVIYSFNIFGNKTIREISDITKTPITPSKYTFAIWGIIHAWELSFIICSFIDPTNNLIWIISIWYCLLCVFRNAWLVVFCKLYIGLSLLFIIMSHFCLSIIYFSIQVSYINFSSQLTIWCFYVPFSVYYAWISYATILNFYVYATFKTTTTIDQDLLNTSFSRTAFFVLILLASITSLFLFFTYDIPFSIIILCALTGIVYENYHNEKIVAGVVLSTIIILSFFIYAIVIIIISAH